MQLLKLVAHHIKIGVPLPFGVRNEEGKLLLACGQVVASEAQLEALLDRGAYADVEEIQAWQRALQETAQAKKPERQLTLFDHWAQMSRRSSMPSPTSSSRWSIAIPMWRSTARSARTRGACRSTAWRMRCTPRWRAS